jgi:hypothetical protein
VGGSGKVKFPEAVDEFGRQTHCGGKVNKLFSELTGLSGIS